MIFYLFKSIFISFLLIGLYLTILRNNKSFTFNRLFLIASAIASLVFPMIDFSISISENDNIFIYNSAKFIEQIEIVPITIQSNTIQSLNNSNWSILLIACYFIISGILLIKFIRNISSLYSNQLIISEPVYEMQVLFHNNNGGIYSFFNRLYLPIKYKRESLNDSILMHELTHFKQLHSLDIILIELILILFWFNPFLWYFKKEIKENHEFLADQSVINEENKTNYIQTILSQVNVKPQISISTNFSYISIKKRIKMIQRSNNKFKIIFSNFLVLVMSIGLLSLISFKASDIDQSLNQQLINSFKVDLLKKPTGSPIEYKLITDFTSDFGMRQHPISKKQILHTGIDLIASEGTKIIAVGEGAVVKATFSKNYGNHIIIEHNAKYSTLYAHLKSIHVKAGDSVEEKTEIGVIGNTGKSVKTHLHFELIENGKKINPEFKMPEQ